MSDYFQDDNEEDAEIVELMYCTQCRTHYEYRRLGKSEKCKCDPNVSATVSAFNHIFSHFNLDDKKDKK